MKKLLIIITSVLCFHVNLSHADNLQDFLERIDIKQKIREKIANQDINFGTDIGKINIVNGVSLTAKYQYDVEASYINKAYTRIDKWDLAARIDAGDLLKDLIDIPFSFSINRDNSFFFVRQFQNKKDAIIALPYTPLKLPLNAKLALKNLEIGDFVSIPANLNIAVGVKASTSMVSSVIVNANAEVFYVISGEFIVQVFKLDNTHVRLKLIAKSSRDFSAKAGIGIGFNIFGIKILDNQLDKMLERDLAQYGYSYDPGAQFIVDYVFDLSNDKAAEAYNQILNSNFKFKDLIVTDMINGKELKDKIISSYEKADAIFEEDKNIEPKNRRVQRLFKGFNNYQGHTRHLSFSFLITGYTKNRTFTENNITFVDKKENNLEFFYPNLTKYTETHLGKWFYAINDKSLLNNFGLIPKFNLRIEENRNPDLGFTFERDDKFFTIKEQRLVERYLLTQIPKDLVQNIGLNQWRDGVKKIDSHIFFELVLKSQGFPYLKNIPAAELKAKLFAYYQEKREYYLAEENSNEKELKNLFYLYGKTKKIQLSLLADSLSTILLIQDNKEMLKKLVSLNEFGIYDKIGLGFLISLLPQERLSELVYLKLQITALKMKPIDVEKGVLNYKVIYNELNLIQNRLSNRGYDLRLSDADRNLEDLDLESQQRINSF